MNFLPQTLIRKKRDGKALLPDELRGFITGVSDGSIPDYQVSAMLMAIFFQGLDNNELAAWADAMLHSGDVLDLNNVTRPKIDKHSTGGVGDKISLPLAPAVAACGVAVPMISGRGLGHTGGTLDKLESIPGFSVTLSPANFAQQVQNLGVCLIGQTKNIVPADKRLYSLRDVTATVESIPLIASSIMSKKLAEGIDALVLDCKVGHGAFMKTMDGARALALAIQTIGRSAGKPVTAVLTDMNAPIGTMVGNALEVLESIDVLKGGGPQDTRELTVVLGGEMLYAAGVVDSPELGQTQIAGVLDDGSAAQRFAHVIEAQGGNPNVIDSPASILPQARSRTDLVSQTQGVVSAIAAQQIGVAGVWLGAGRKQIQDAIDPAVGIELQTKVGDSVSPGTVLATLHHNHRGVDEASKLVLDAFSVTSTGCANVSRILEILRS